MSLDSRPTADVTVTVTSGDDGAASVSPASYTFTPSGWNLSQIFTVSGVADADTDDESVSVSNGAASGDGKYDGIAVASVAVSVTDDTPEQQQTAELPGPVAGLQLSATLDSVTVTWRAPESGGAPDRYIARLRPAGGGQGKDRTIDAGKTTTTFRNLESGARYKVWVRAQNEGGKGERSHASITLPELPGPVAGLLLEATADSVTVSWQAPLSGGAPDRYAVRLRPADGGQGKDRTVKAGKTTTTFRNLEPGATYEVRVRAENEWGKGERASASVTLPAGGVQGGEGDPPPEQQQAARTFSASASASAAEGTNAALTVTLSEAAPAGGVAFTVTADYSGQTAEAADVGSITSPVTVAEGETALDISVPIADDAVDEDDETFTVTVSTSASGWEKAGDGQDTATITITDDDTAGVTVTPTTLNISEDGRATYTVVLDSKPTADVTVTATSSDSGAASFAPASHTFTPSGWNTPQTFTVSGVADEDRDNESVTVSHRVTGGDAKYHGVTVDSVAVTVTDTTPEPEQEDAGPPVAGQTEPYNVQVTPGDGTLTVTWRVAPREGVSNDEIKHALRWSQEAGVWANPVGPNAVGPNDGISVEGGVTTYTITGLRNGVATGVFIRSFTGGNYNEDSPESSRWVRLKGEHTTPKAAE